MRHFTAKMFMSSQGELVPARATDQANKKGFGDIGRTYKGKPVVYCGDSYTVNLVGSRERLDLAIKEAKELLHEQLINELKKYHAGFQPSVVC